MSNKLNFLFGFFLLFVLASCRINLPEGEKIYRGAAFKLVKSEGLNENYEGLKESLLEFTRPAANTTIGNFPYKVALKYAVGKQKSDKGIKAWINNSFGENPVFFDENLLEKNVTNLTDVLKNKGYFNAKVMGKLDSNGTYTNALYTIKPEKRYKIDTVIYSNREHSNFDKDFYAIARKIALGDFFDLEEIKAMRVKIDEDMRQLGYYNFRPDLVAVLADTMAVKGKVQLKIEPKDNVTEAEKKLFQINDIFVNVDSKTEIIPNHESTDFFRGLIQDDPKVRFKPYVFNDAIAFRPGTFFNQSLQSITNKRLLGLGTFKSVKSSFEVVNRLDSTLLDLHYFLQTQKRKSLKTELNGISRSSGLGGSQLSINWQNVNCFHGAEFFKISSNVNSEFQFGGKKEGINYRSNYRIGFDAIYSIPRFWAPYIKIDPEVSSVLPKTTLKLSYENFIKTGLYNLNSFKATLSYSWNKGNGIEHTFRPIGINFIKSTNISYDFINAIFADPRLLVILDNQLIAGGGYDIIVNTKSYNKSSFSYRGSVDFAGNLLSLKDFFNKNTDTKGKIFKETFSQFFRIENDFRYKNQVSNNLAWANRAIVGLGLPYGSSLQLPFGSQFYVGGNNSLRAFRARGVGPGTYVHDPTLVASSFLGNNTGDIKLEFNTELRYKVNNLLNMALFADMGNIWMYKDSYIYGDGSLFTKNFYKQMAIGSGIGFRFDLSFVIFRIDIATPLRNPWLTSSPWVIKDANLRNKLWLRDNLIWNIAIGLPF